MVMMTAISPIDGSTLGEFEVSSNESIQQAMAASRIAAQQWVAVDIDQRCKRLGELRQLLLTDIDAICDIISRTTGKVLTEALLGELYPVLDLTDYYAQHTKRILSPKGVATSPFGFPGATASIIRKPYGVVAIISPWNYPFQITVSQILCALFAGNAVIFKTSELSLPVGQLIVELFAKLDVPINLVQWVIGDGACGEYLIDTHPDLVVFTGSLASGRKVMQRAAQHPVPVILELGGKDAMIVFADAELKRAADGALYGAFCNSGQACISVERLYVEQSCFDTFLSMLLNGIAKLKVGHGEVGDLGAMTSQQQIEIVKKQYEDALAKGAKVSGPLIDKDANNRLNQQAATELTGSQKYYQHYLRPVLLWDVTSDMLVMQQETFGPLLPVLPFNNEDEAVQYANTCEYGLNASVWSNDIAKAERIAAQLDVGNWSVNDVLKNAGHPGLPFGGVNKSGFGRHHGAEGLRQFTYPVSGLTSRSHLPKEPNWFPYSTTSYSQFKGYLDFVFGSGSFVARARRNWETLQAFREYSAFDLKQRWQNFKLLLRRRQDL